MKPTHSSSVGEVFLGGRKLQLPISAWEESSFSLTVETPLTPVNRLEVVWEDVEACGAADDATRFQITEFPAPEFFHSCP